MKRIVAISTALTIITSGLNYATQITITEIAGFESRAQIEILSSIIALSSSIFSFNTYLALTLYSKKYTASPANLNNIFVYTTLLQIAGAALIYGLAISNILKLNYIASIVLISIAIALNNYSNIITALMSGMQIFLKPKLINLIAAFATLILIVTISKIGYKSEGLLIYIGSLSTLIICGLMFSRSAGNKSNKISKIDFSIKKATLDLWPVYVISIAQLFLSKVYFLYLINRESLEYIGEFVFALSITQIFLLPATVLASIVISKSKAERFDDYIKYIIFAYFLLTAVIYLCLELNLNEYFFLKSFQSPGFIANTKLLILMLPFSAVSTIAISYSIAEKYFSDNLIYSQCAALPVALLAYKSLSFLNEPRAAVMAFVIASILVAISTVASIKR